jgi:chaperonin cofactor prefoldin
MSAIDTTALIVSICTIVAFVTGSIKWLTKHYFDEIKAEFKPNGGSSLRDQVDRLESNHSRLEEKIDKVTDMLIEHVIQNSNK